MEEHLKSDYNKSAMKNDYIIDNSEYVIGKDTDGNIMTTKDLHNVLLEMITKIDEICRKHNVPYALGFGSALGAYNYAGFIPWDDDMDIVVPYEDWPRLVEAMKEELKDDYCFDCYENDRRYNVLIPSGKFYKLDTYLKEKNHITLPNKCKGGQAVFIDFVMFMGVPQDLKEHKKLISYSKNRMPMYVLLDGILRFNVFGLKKRLKKHEAKVAEAYKDSPYVSQTVLVPWQAYDKSVHSWSFPREIIYPFREYDFEGHKFYSFNDIKTFSQMRYGEKSTKVFDGEKYIDNYPIEKRKVKHIKDFNLFHKK